MQNKAFVLKLDESGYVLYYVVEGELVAVTSDDGDAENIIS